MFNGSSSIVPGLIAPPYVSGNYYKPQWAVTNSTLTLTTTAGRLYYAPIYIRRYTTFANMAAFNSGAGDNGEAFRMGVYASNSSGLPGTLIAAFGENTLTGAAAVRDGATPASAACSVGVAWLAIHTNTAAAFYGIAENLAISAAGVVSGIAQLYQNEFGIKTLDTTNMFTSAGLYVDTSYGALASTAVAPTASTNVVPAMWLKA